MSTRLSVNDTTDVNYLVLDDSNDNNKPEMRNLTFWTTPKIAFCMLLQTFALIVVFGMVLGLYVDRSNYSLKAVSEARVTNKADQNSTSDELKRAGVTYVRWGRTECSDTAEFVYSGFTAGAKGGTAVGDGQPPIVDAPGGGSNYLCLPHTPHFNLSTPGQQDTRSRIYATEYRSLGKGQLKDYNFYEAPCAMCQSTGGRTQSFMMPATIFCPTGWTREYYGWLAAARWNHPRSEYVCVDSNPEVVNGTDPVVALSMLFHVEVVSSEGLPDEYVTGNDMTCAVCTM